MARAARRVGPALVLLLALLVLAIGFTHKASCLAFGFEKERYRLLCYSDIVPLYHQDLLSLGRFPYLQGPNQYPVLTGLFMWTASLPGHGEVAFFAANAALLGGLALLVAWSLRRMVGARALFFAAAPSLALYAFLNWDLLPIALSTLATLAYMRRRDRLSGVLLGLGAAAKIYPALLVIPFALGRRREEDRRGAARIVGFAVAAFALVNLPFAVLAFGRWSFFYRYSSSRAPTFGTLWYLVHYLASGDGPVVRVGLVNVLSLVAFAAIAALVWHLRAARDLELPLWTFAFPLLVAFLLTNKVFSPQYSLWLLPWFALVLPDLRIFLAFEAADVAVFVTEFSWLASRTGGGGLPYWPLGVAVLARAAVLVWMLASYVTTERRLPHLAGSVLKPMGAA